MVYCATSGFEVEETEASAEGSNEYREPHPIEVSKRTAIEHTNTIRDLVKAGGAPFLKNGSGEPVMAHWNGRVNK